MDVPKIKSVGFLAIKDYIIEHFGENAYKEILTQMDEDNRRAIESLITVSQWYPEETCRHFLIAMQKTLSSYGKLEKIVYDMGYVMALAHIPNFYKSLIRLLDFNFSFKITTKLWRLYHTHGEVRAEQAGSHRVHVHIIDYPTPNKLFCLNMAGYIHGVVRLSGFELTEPIKEIECVLEGGTRCTFLVVWG